MSGGKFTHGDYAMLIVAGFSNFGAETKAEGGVCMDPTVLGLQQNHQQEGYDVSQMRSSNKRKLSLYVTILNIYNILKLHPKTGVNPPPPCGVVENIM